MSGLSSAKELREQRMTLHTEAQTILDAAAATKRALTAEEETRFDKLSADIDALAVQVERIEKHEARAKELSESRGRQVPPAGEPGAGAKSEADVDFNSALRSWMLYGDSDLTPAERQALAPTQFRGDTREVDGVRTQRPIGSKDARTIRFLSPAEKRAIRAAEQRAQTVTTTGGGYLIPQGFSGQLEESLLEYGGMFSASDVFDTDSGADLPWPTTNDTGNVGELLAINTAAAEQDATFGQVTFKAWKYSSKMIRVPIELMQDSAFDIGTFLANALGERVGRITNTHFTTGDDSGKPQGIVTASSVGKTGTTGQTVSVIYEDLVDLVHSVNPAYRRQGAAFMMADSSVKVIRKLKDSNGLPLWQPSVQLGAPDAILGHPVLVNEDVAAMAANAKSILFGAIKKYKIRRVRDITLVRLNERYGELYQVAFVAFARYDGRMLDAGTDPVKHYANSAT